MLDPTLIATAVVALLFGGAVLWLYQKSNEKRQAESLEQQKQQVLDAVRAQADVEAEKKLLAAEQTMMDKRRFAEEELGKQRNQIERKQQTVERREEELQAFEKNIRRQQAQIEAANKKLQAQNALLQNKWQQVERSEKRYANLLESAAGMSRDEAVHRLLEKLEGELTKERAAAIIRYRKSLEQQSKEIGRDILLSAIQRFSAQHTAESTTGTVDVPSDDIKGRIIGREGRNIRAFEKITGVDVIIDDTPGVVIISSFDPVRREVARQALERLIADGRIHPGHIETFVQEAEASMEDFLLRKGTEAATEVNVDGLNETVLRMLGRLHFRSSFSQNVLRHSVEVSFVAGLVAEMIDLDPSLARASGLLHDIGKAADHELEGGHPKIGADFLRRNGLPDEVVRAAGGHHDEIVVEHPYTMLTAIGDACSASRPGARRESLERYVKRMEDLEAIAKGFDGVHRAYAISAGRELRVIVSSKKTNDEQAAIICREIAKRLESELTYPGEIKVTVMRESRFIETAR